ncbi:MAG TPA: tryptophan 7-halogenase [Novosphingobium sp.]|nr:tryptophan 7-halogenase [Novosphingobium sp.]
MNSAGHDKAMRIVIVGGGTAGGMAAAALSRYFGRSLAITLIESDAIGIIGVGEATIPQIRLFNAGLGIDEAQFLRETNGTIKLGIEFVGWHREGEAYFHGFGDYPRTPGLVPFHHYWLRHFHSGGTLLLDDFSANPLAAREGRYGLRPGGPPAGRLPASAYHFDASLYAGFLRRYAEARGVVRREGVVRDVLRDGESGFLTALSMAGGSRVEGDLFLDCTGFRGLLIEQALNSGYEDWSHWLPCDRAIAMPSAGDGRMEPFTRSTARKAGWQWHIPLQHRTGNGHVYSSSWIGDDEAEAILRANLPGEALAEPRLLRFLTGKRRQIWKGNCIALGLSSGFLEPLESTSIHLIQSGIARLLALFPTVDCAPRLADEFNRQMDAEYAAIRDFLILHYHANAREGLPFWDHCRHMTIPDGLAAKLDMFRESGRIIRQDMDLFDVPSWLQVMWGQGLRASDHHPLVDAASSDDFDRFLAASAREARSLVDGLDDHKAWLRRLREAA